MSDEPGISFSPALAALVFGWGRGDYGRRAVRALERHQQLLLEADRLNISRQDVDARLATSGYIQTRDWMYGAEWKPDTPLAEVISRLASGGSL